jgi:hypothetical protein
VTLKQALLEELQKLRTSRERPLGASRATKASQIKVKPALDEAKRLLAELETD